MQHASKYDSYRRRLLISSHIINITGSRPPNPFPNSNLNCTCTTSLSFDLIPFIIYYEGGNKVGFYGGILYKKFSSISMEDLEEVEWPRELP